MPVSQISLGFTGHEHLSQFVLINMKGRIYDPAVGRFLSPDILVQQPEMGLSYNRYSYCLNNPLKYVDPSGWVSTNPTNYVDEFGNTLLNTDDGSQDRIVVPEEMQADFARFGKSHKVPGMEVMYDEPNWNKHMKSEILGVSSFALDMSLGLYRSQEGRQAAIDYMQNPSFANSLNMVWQEAKAQWHDPMLVASGLAIGLQGLGAVQSLRAAKGSAKLVDDVVVHGNSLASKKPTWGYKLYSNDGTFLKNGITSKLKPEARYTKAFMQDKYLGTKRLFPNRRAAYDWEYLQNTIQRGPLNKNMH